MSTGRPQDLNRDLGSGLAESVGHEWKTKKGDYNGTTEKSFNEIIKELMIIKKKDKYNELRYNDNREALDSIPATSLDTLEVAMKAKMPFKFKSTQI